jgi:hypothetical protein
MKYIYEYIPELNGWKKIYTAQSFHHACEVCREMQQANKEKQFCVNN